MLKYFGYNKINKKLDMFQDLLDELKFFIKENIKYVSIFGILALFSTVSGAYIVSNYIEEKKSEESNQELLEEIKIQEFEDKKNRG